MCPRCKLVFEPSGTSVSRHLELYPCTSVMFICTHLCGTVCKRDDGAQSVWLVKIHSLNCLVECSCIFRALDFLCSTTVGLLRRLLLLSPAFCGKSSAAGIHRSFTVVVDFPRKGFRSGFYLLRHTGGLLRIICSGSFWECLVWCKCLERIVCNTWKPRTFCLPGIHVIASRGVHTKTTRFQIAAHNNQLFSKLNFLDELLHWTKGQFCYDMKPLSDVFLSKALH